MAYGSKNNWQTELCACESNRGECCKAFVFPCCVIGTNTQKMQKKGVQLPNEITCCNIGIDSNVKTGTVYGLAVVVSGLGIGGQNVCSTSPLATMLQCFAYYMHARLRQNIRNKNTIKAEACKCCGEFTEDCCTVIFCTSCALAQESRELDGMADTVPQSQETTQLIHPDQRNSMRVPGGWPGSNGMNNNI